MSFNGSLIFPNNSESGRANAIITRARGLMGINQAENEGTGRMMRNYWRIRNARDRMLQGLARGNSNG